MKPEQAERIRSLMVDTISLLCRNGLDFENELRLQAVIGITLDGECFVIHINKCFERTTLQDEENCEREERQNESLHEKKSEEAEVQPPQNTVDSAIHEAPPSPCVESSYNTKKPVVSQDMCTPVHEESNSQQLQPVSQSNLANDDCTSKTDMQMAKPGMSKHESVDDCAEFIANWKQQKMNKTPAPVDSDDCDDISVFTTDSEVFKQTSVQQQQYYKSSQPTRNKLRHRVEGYRPRTRKQNVCEDPFDAEDDFCSDFNVGQQFMYIDAGRLRARPKAPKQQQHDVYFDSRCTPSTADYGMQDVRLLVLTNCYHCCVCILNKLGHKTLCTTNYSGWRIYLFLIFYHISTTTAIQCIKCLLPY